MSVKPDGGIVFHKYGGNDSNAYETKIIVKERMNPIWKWVTIIATILGLITGGLALYDYMTPDNNMMVQDVSPEVREKLKNLKPGESIPVMKGRPLDEPRSGSD